MAIYRKKNANSHRSSKVNKEVVNQSTANTISTRNAKHKAKSATMSSLKSGRLQVLTAYYKTNALQLLNMMQARGKNDYNAIMTRIDNIVAASDKDKVYHNALTNAFTRKGPMNASQVSAIVCEQRAKVGLPRLTGNILKQSIEELHKLFLVEEKMQPISDTKKERVYRPAFSLLIN